MRRFYVVLLIALFALSSLPMKAEAAGELDAVDCTGYTFEHLFEYDFAGFQVEVMDDWAQMVFSATAWVNNTNAATVRENIDGLFEGQNGGDNNWLSTDERDAVREIGPMCIADMDSRMGLREGVPHRGEVDWNDVEFVEDGIKLSETDLIPADNPQERDCQNTLASTGCREVPVSATEDLTISMSLKEGENHNARFNQLPNKGNSNFTLSLNSSNMSSAQLVFEFPPLQGLRIAGYDWLEDGVVVSGHPEPQEEYLPDGSLKLIIDTSYNRQSSPPMVQELFIDFTTMPPDVNDIPEWTANAPSNGSIIPIKGVSEEVAIPKATLESWANDEDGWVLNCSIDNQQTWSTSINSDGDLLVEKGDGDFSELTCGLTDKFGENGEEVRIWKVGTLFGITSESGKKSDTASISLNPTGLASDFDIKAMARQDSIDGAELQQEGLDQSTEITISLTGLKPGAFNIVIVVSGTDMISRELEYNLAMVKESKPPSIILDDPGVNGWTWDGENAFVITGTALDPDGEKIDLMATLCGATTENFKTTGSKFEVTIRIAACGGTQMDSYDVMISATDESSNRTDVTVTVDRPDDSNSLDWNDDKESEKTSSSEDTPFIGVIGTLAMLVGAAAIISRRD